jgi:multiple sugar transport system permease protein
VRPLVRGVVLACLAIAIAIFAGFPLYWMVVTALQYSRDVFAWPPHFFPNVATVNVFPRLFETLPILDWIGHSTLVAGGTALVAVVLSVPGAYSLSRFRRWGWACVGFMILLTQMIPGVVIIAPLFILFRALHLLNTFTGLVAVEVCFTAPVVLWIVKGFFDTIPMEIEEAAWIDGCSLTRTLVLIALPLAAPAIVGAFAIAFFAAWNDYLFPLVLVSDQSHWVASVGVASWIGELTVPIDRVMAGGVIFALPSVLLFAYLQRYLVLSTAKMGSIR